MAKSSKRRSGKEIPKRFLSYFYWANGFVLTYLAERFHETETTRKVKKAKSSSGAFIDDDSDLKEDLAQSESQQLLATSKVASEVTVKQCDAHVAQFRAEVERTRQELSNVLLEKTLDVLQLDARAEAAYLSTVIYSLTTHHILTDLEPSLLHSKSTTALHPLRQMAESLLGSAKRLLQVYDRLSQEIVSPEGSMEIGKEWDDDWGRLNSLFENQGKVMKHRVIVCLQGRHTSIKLDGAADKAREEHVWKEFAGSQIEDKIKDSKDESWGVVVRRVQRGVVRLTKHLQDEE